MNFIFEYSLFHFIFLIFSIFAFANDLQIGEPILGGNGCPKVTLALVSNNKYEQENIKFHFDHYSVEAGKNTGKKFDRKNCSIAIPVQVPQGYSIAFLPGNIHGHTTLPIGGHLRIHLNYFFAGDQGISLKREFNGKQDQDFLVTSDSGPLVWSACGANTNLRINSSMIIQVASNDEPAQGTIEELTEFKIKRKKCQ